MTRSQQLVRSRALADAALQGVVARSFKDLRFVLSANPALDPLIWTELYQSRPKISSATASNLLCRSLTPEQIDFALANEKRTTPISVMVCRNQLSLVQAQQVLETDRLGKEGAEQWLRSSTVPLEIAGRVLVRAPALVRLDWLVKNRASLSPEFLGQQVGLLRFAANLYADSHAIPKLLLLSENHPSLLDVMVSSPDALVQQAAATSRHLSDAQAQLLADAVGLVPSSPYYKLHSVRVAIALLRNLAVSPVHAQVATGFAEALKGSTRSVLMDVAHWRTRHAPWKLTTSYEEVQDQKEFEQILWRTLPKSGGWAGQTSFIWCDIVALLHNRVLEHDQAARVANRLLDSTFSTRSGTPEGDAFDAFLDFYQLMGGSKSYRSAQEEKRSLQHLLPHPSGPAGPVESWPLAVLDRENNDAVQYLLEGIGHDPQLLEVLLGMVDSFEGTLSETVELVRSL